MKIQHFFDKETSTLTYVVFDEVSKDAVIIDPVLDFDPPSGIVEDKSLKLIVDFVQEQKLRPHYVLETHAHADHLSSSQVLKKYFPEIKVAISSRIKVVQKVFEKVFNLSDFKADGSDFDLLIQDNQEFKAGSLSVKAIPTPGHTPACTSYLINGSLFSGDALFMPDSGCGRCDFPNGSAEDLFESIRCIYSLSEETPIFVGHDYQPGGRELKFQTTVGESKKSNIQIKSSTSREEFVSFRQARDKTLKAPRLLLPSLQVNICAGRLPRPDSNGISYLKLPMKPLF